MTQALNGHILLNFLKELPKDPELKYTLSEKSDYYRLIVDFNQDKYETLKVIPPAALSVAEQFLFNLIFNQPKSENNFFVDKFYREKLFFYLQDIPSAAVPQVPKEKTKLKYLAEINRQFCKIVIDLSGTGADSLKNLDKKKLSPQERVFISYLSNVPFNNGAFYFNQQAMGRLFYFLAKLDNVFDIKTNEKINIGKNFIPQLLIKKNKTGNQATLLEPAGKNKLNHQQYLVIGDKNYAIYYKEIFYPLSNFNYALLQVFHNQGIELNNIELADFLSVFASSLARRTDLELLLPEAISSFQETIIEKEPIPTLNIIVGKQKRLKAEFLLDYGQVKIPARPQDPNPYYQTDINSKKHLLKRDIKSEEWLHNFLLDKKFTHSKNIYHIHEDDFIDFFTYECPALQKTIGLKITGENLKDYFFEGQELDVLFDFRESSGIDWFEFKPLYKFKETSFTQEEIAGLLAGNNRYVRLADGKLATIPKQKFDNINTYLEGTKQQKGKYLLQKNNLYFLYSLARADIKAEMDNALKKLLANLQNFNGLEENKLPLDVSGTPRHYQTAGYNWLLFLNRHGFHGILADDMGVGKTFQVLLLLLYLKQQKPTKNTSLIIAPTSVIYNWLAEAEKFTPDLKVAVVFGAKNRAEIIKAAGDYDLLVTSYALLRNDLEHYAKHNFNYVILDEAQYIKNKKALSTKAVKSLKCSNRLALTGTPIENRLSELWSIFDFLMPGFLSSYPYFRTFYEADTAKLKAKIRPFVLRRTKQDVLTELPDKNEIDSFCTMLPEQENLYLNILQSQKKELFNVIDNKGLGRSQINILSALLKLRQICCHPRLLKLSNPIHSAKFDLFKELLQEIIDDGHKVVIFTQFVQMLQIIKKHLDEHNHSYSYLDGSTKKRQTIIEDFNRDDKKQIFLCSLKAGGVGINLTAANYVILYDPWWNPAVEQQAMDRVHRLGQQKKVFVYKLITKGTVEEKIMRLKARKKDLLSSVIDQEKEFTKSISREELETLFSY